MGDNWLDPRIVLALFVWFGTWMILDELQLGKRFQRTFAMLSLILVVAALCVLGGPTMQAEYIAWLRNGLVGLAWGMFTYAFLYPIREWSRTKPIDRDKLVIIAVGIAGAAAAVAFAVPGGRDYVVVYLPVLAAAYGLRYLVRLVKSNRTQSGSSGVSE
jgi:hypothetical protein